MGRTPLYSVGLVVLVICVVVPIASTVVAFATFPDIVPIRFSFDGEVKRWAPKGELFILGGITASVNLIMLAGYVKAAALKRYGMLNAPGKNEVRNGRIIVAICGFIVAVAHLVALAMIGSIAAG